MGGEGDPEADLQRQIDANRADINALFDRSERAEARADKADLRAEEMQSRVDLDRELIAELQADGVLSREHAAQMEEALRTSRVIGAAIGLIMAGRLVTQDEAFEILKGASSSSNRKLRDLAAEIVEAGRLGQLRA